jgi:beta-lactamase regulating signal transducer with metallopeptidase domain
MNELLDGLWQASLWLAVGVVLLAVTRPLLVRLGGAGLAYRSWWLLPLMLATLLIPLPQVALLQHVPTLPLKVVPEAVDSLPTASLQWPLVLLLVWTLGTGACLLRDLRAQRRFERNLGALRPRTDGSWQASGDPGLPALVGLWRPRIVVGPDFDQQFTAQEQALILQHEHSHRRNGDHWANGVLLLMRAVFWFHPLLPWAARRFLRDQELACDARTIAPQPALRGLYASTLLKAQLVHPVAPAVCHWRSQPVLKERIAMLKLSKRHCRGCRGRCWWSGCAWGWGRWRGPARVERWRPAQPWPSWIARSGSTRCHHRATRRARSSRARQAWWCSASTSMRRVLSAMCV